MSVNDECELQELVKETLERMGALPKLRAQLRANVFLALDENGAFQGMKTENCKFFEKSDSLLLISLVKEFLDYFGLSFTISVFDQEIEALGVTRTHKSRNDLMKELNVSFDTHVDTQSPLLYQLLQQLRTYQHSVKAQVLNNVRKQVVTSPSTHVFNDHSSGDNLVIIEATSESHVLGQAQNKEFNLDLNKNVAPLLTSLRDPTEYSKHNLSSLDDLPPLNSGKSGSSPTTKSTQMIKLKAMLMDSHSESNSASNSFSINDELLEKSDETINKLEQSQKVEC